MKNKILIEATEDTPQIEIDKDFGKIEITGRSLPEDAVLLYQPVRNWLNEYLKNPGKETEVKLFLEYYNSSTARQFFDFFLMLEELAANGSKVVIKWYYKTGDELMQERGSELKEVTQIPFELIEI